MNEKDFLLKLDGINNRELTEEEKAKVKMDISRQAEAVGVSIFFMCDFMVKTCEKALHDAKLISDEIKEDLEDGFNLTQSD